jgi:hypothetical protein
LIGTSFVGANLSGADLRFAAVTGADFTNANLSNALMSLVANADNISFAGANIQGLDLSNAVLENVDFTGSTGTPKLNSTTIATSTCPDGSASTATSPYCTWTPTAISLAALDGTAVSEVWPAALFALLFGGTAAFLLSKRRRKMANIAV